jgi:hypothetical protein
MSIPPTFLYGSALVLRIAKSQKPGIERGTERTRKSAPC